MKKAICFVMLLLAFSSCTEEGDLTTRQVPGTVAETAAPKFKGTFEPTSGINASGDVIIYKDEAGYKLDFENLSVSDGPDLKVYLSKAAFPQEFVNLGNFNAENVYNIPAGVAVEDYSHVLVHCQQYNHLFAIAPLHTIP